MEEITPEYLKEIQPAHPTVDVVAVYEAALNRSVWAGYKDKRRALNERIGWAEEKAAQPQRGGNGNGMQPATPKPYEIPEFIMPPPIPEEDQLRNAAESRASLAEFKKLHPDLNVWGKGRAQ